MYIYIYNTYIYIYIAGWCRRAFRARRSAVRVEGWGFRVWGLKVSGFGSTVSGFGFRVSGFRFRVRVSGFDFRVECSRAPRSLGQGLPVIPTLLVPMISCDSKITRRLSAPLASAFKPRRETAVCFHLTEFIS